jgi:ABC-type sugar transport system substrate-binding protein
MKKICLYLITICVVFSFSTSRAATEKLLVTFINPGVSDVNDPTGGFWLSVSSFMKAAAEDLNIELEIIYSERNHILMQQQAKDVVERKNPPNYLIVVNEKLRAKQMVIDSNNAGVKVFVMLNIFDGEQQIQMGPPRYKYKNWIGTLIPDNHFAGYEIARRVIDHALDTGVKSADGLLHLIGISGDPVTQASIERVNGLKQAVSEYPNVNLKQVFVGYWRKDISKKKVMRALKRYPNTGAIWAANDPMAIGAVEAVFDNRKKPGKDIFIGGLNWDIPGLKKIKKGEMVTSIGGHFMTGGWVLVLLHDYHHGKDFAEEGLQLKQQIFGALHRQNIDRFLKYFGGRNWSIIDYTRFSKVLNPNITRYNFNLEEVLKQFK